MIRIEHIKKKFKKLIALDDINAVLEKGQVISLIGPNGSGKTTLIKSILGMVKPDKGRIFFNNEPINGDPSYRSQIGYMPQIGRYPDNMRVGQLFKMLKNIRNVSGGRLDEELVEKFKLKEIFNKPMRTLSGGTRQKVSAALAFLFDPGVLILDEPTAGLDPLSSEILKEKILKEKTRNKLILITSHILSDLDELTTHIMYLQEGRLEFFKEIEQLREETGELKLGKAIARIMKGEKFNNEWIDKMFEGKGENKVY
jgi:Cu-processing system ATP-binding protein